jgi:predicted nucleotidyltransferase
MNHGLPDGTVEKIHSVLRLHPEVETAVLYGSRALGTFKNGSDIDLTLRGGDRLGHTALLRIMDELDELLLPYTIDLSIFADLRDADLLDHIRRAGVEVYRRDGG